MTDRTDDERLSDLDLRELIRAYELADMTKLHIPFHDEVLACLRELQKARDELDEPMDDATRYALGAM